MIHQDLPHQVGGYAEKLSARVPRGPGLVYQSQIGLVHQRGGLQGVVMPFAAQVGGGQRAELPINQRYQFVQGVFIAAAPGLEQSRYVSWLAFRHHSSQGILLPRDDAKATGRRHKTHDCNKSNLTRHVPSKTDVGFSAGFLHEQVQVHLERGT